MVGRQRDRGDSGSTERGSGGAIGEGRRPGGSRPSDEVHPALHRIHSDHIRCVAPGGLHQRFLAQGVEAAGPPEVTGEMAVLDEAGQRPLADPGWRRTGFGEGLVDRRHEAARQDEVAQA
jgi:hypothetical protein